jgi:hypothetical protein
MVVRNCSPQPTGMFGMTPLIQFVSDLPRGFDRLVGDIRHEALHTVRTRRSITPIALNPPHLSAEWGADRDGLGQVEISRRIRLVFAPSKWDGK